MLVLQFFFRIAGHAIFGMFKYNVKLYNNAFQMTHSIKELTGLADQFWQLESAESFNNKLSNKSLVSRIAIPWTAAYKPPPPPPSPHL